MANERTYPCLPCADIDQAIAFYEAIGFTRTYRQIAPNPYAVMAREDFHIHLFVMPEFDPANSYGCVIVAVPDVDALYRAFATGLRAVYGKLPVAGIPRITRPRKKLGVVHGFALIDVGGNWLRISKQGSNEESEEKKIGLAKALDVATRLGDSHGDEAKALKALENGLQKYPNAPILERAQALLYRAELSVRLHHPALARASLSAALALEMSEQEKAAIASELAQTSEIVNECPSN